ncbi:MAG TPA: DUF1697 domain-containing protein [Bacteroidales bacterium]|nr:DUF1697 domain-containing protein [Bacteroidales bacterium]HSA44462.1 DUF1697 domain-containing protein [Bacteroidales bacterium]
MASVVLLRGVNVGGNRTFRPAILAAQLSHCDVVNIGAAGTFVVRKAVAQEQLLEEFRQRLPFKTDIIIVEGSDIAGIMRDHPFHDQELTPDVTRFVSFLTRLPESEPVMPFEFPESGSWVVRILARKDRFIYGIYRRDMKAISYLGRLDKRFGVPLSTRNWNTIAAIARVLDAPVTPSPEEATENGCNHPAR